MVKQLLFRLAKSPGMGRLVGWAFRWCWWAIPVRKLVRSKRVLAFEHPRPAYQNHVILSPRGPVRDLLQMGEEKHTGCFQEIWQAVQTLAATRPEYRQGFTLAANGGKRQEVGQVHFHLFTGHPLVSGTPAREEAGETLFCNDAVCIRLHPSPEWELHLVLCPAAPAAAFQNSTATGIAKATAEYLRAIPRALAVLQSYFSITEKGYSLVYQPNDTHTVLPAFHLIAGRKIRNSP